MCLACVRAFTIYKSLLPLHLTGDCQACGTLLSLTRLVGLGLGLADLLPSFPPPPDLIFVWLFLLVFFFNFAFCAALLACSKLWFGFCRLSSLLLSSNLHWSEFGVFIWREHRTIHACHCFDWVFFPSSSLWGFLAFTHSVVSQSIMRRFIETFAVGFF